MEDDWQFTCPNIIMGAPLIFDPEMVNFLTDGSPSNHICANPDAESHVMQIECHVFSL